MELVSENVVLTARQFNPSIVSQLWLVRNGIVGEDEFRPGMLLFTPPLVHFTTNKFEMLLTEDRLQITPRCSEQEKAQILSDRISRFVGTLPHTPYTALGMNFVWAHEPSIDVSRFTKSLFLNRETKLAKEFDEASAKFGAFYSKPFGQFTLNLKALPVSKTENDAKIFRVQLDFNYHLDTDSDTGESPKLIKSCLTQWREAKDYAERVAMMVVGT